MKIALWNVIMYWTYIKEGRAMSGFNLANGIFISYNVLIKWNMHEIILALDFWRVTCREYDVCKRQLPVIVFKKNPMTWINHPLLVLLTRQEGRNTMSPGWNHLCSTATKFHYDTHSNNWLFHIFISLIFRYLHTKVFT